MGSSTCATPHALSPEHAHPCLDAAEGSSKHTSACTALAAPGLRGGIVHLQEAELVRPPQGGAVLGADGGTGLGAGHPPLLLVRRLRRLLCSRGCAGVLHPLLPAQDVISECVLGVVTASMSCASNVLVVLSVLLRGTLVAATQHAA